MMEMVGGEYQKHQKLKQTLKTNIHLEVSYKKQKDFLVWITSGKGHAGPTYYWVIAAILGIITLVEVWWFDQEGLRYILVPAMLGFSIIKFALVVAFFMHLRFDHKLFSYVFVTCMVIGVFIFSLFILLSAFHGFGG